jgi:hypothetical protein
MYILCVYYIYNIYIRTIILVIHVVSKDLAFFFSGFAIARHLSSFTAEPSHEEDSLAAPAWELQPPFREVAVWSPKKYGSGSKPIVPL